MAYLFVNPGLCLSITEETLGRNTWELAVGPKGWTHLCLSSCSSHRVQNVSAIPCPPACLGAPWPPPVAGRGRA